MEAVTEESFKDRRRRKLSNGHVVAQLLEAPLPRPRRSCCASAVDAPVSRRGTADVSPQRRHVPFSWESSPGVAKSVATGGEDPEALLPPPGRCSAGTLRRAYQENTSDGSSEDGDDTFSDALERLSLSDRLAALSARLSSIDGVTGSRRSPSFLMDRFLPAANAIATTSADKHPRRSSPRRSVRRSKDDADAVARAKHVMNTPRSALAREQPKQQSPPCQSMDAAAPVPLPPRVDEEEQGYNETSARACGLMFFFPWRDKPVLLGFPLSSARSRTSNASVASFTAPSPPRRSVTLMGDVLKKESKLRDGDLSRCYEEKSGSGKEWTRLGWGTALLGTSKRYCADAGKALSRMSRLVTDGGDNPRFCRERRSGKQASSALHSTPDKMPPLSPPSESWLSHARRSNAASNKR